MEETKTDNCFLSYLIQVVPLVPKTPVKLANGFFFDLDKYEIFQIIMTLIYYLFFCKVQLMSQVTTLNGAGHTADMPE